jgi:hypothetical protein
VELVLEGEINKVGLLELSVDVIVADGTKDSITDESFDDSDIHSHFFEFDLEYWHLRSEEEFSERFDTESTDDDHDGRVDKIAFDDFLIVEIDFILIRDCPPEELINRLIFEFLDGLRGHFFILFRVVKIFFGRFVVSVVNKVLVIGFAISEEVEGFILEAEVHR